MIVITEIVQGTEEWFQEKLGKPSASRIDKLITTQGKPSKQKEGYLNELVAERLTGVPTVTHQSQAMLDGIKREAEARSWYEFAHDIEVEQVGVVYHNEEKRFLCSPDGLINREIGLEIKCPEPKTQVSYLREGKLPTTYFIQVQSSIFICGFQEWIFFSWCPGLPFFEIRVKRDDKFCAVLAVELNAFCAELDRLTRELGG